MLVVVWILLSLAIFTTNALIFRRTIVRFWALYGLVKIVMVLLTVSGFLACLLGILAAYGGSGDFGLQCVVCGAAAIALCEIIENRLNEVPRYPRIPTEEPEHVHE